MVIKAIRDIIANPSTASIPSQKDELMAVTAVLREFAAIPPYDHFDAIDTYMVRVFDAGYPEYTVIFLRGLGVFTNRNPQFATLFTESKSMARVLAPKPTTCLVCGNRHKPLEPGFNTCKGCTTERDREETQPLDVSAGPNWARRNDSPRD